MVGNVLVVAASQPGVMGRMVEEKLPLTLTALTVKGQRARQAGF